VRSKEKERRSLGPEFATPAEARARLLSDAAALGSEEGLIGWVTASEGGPSVCEEFFRTGVCSIRRCRHAHIESISALSGVPPTPGPTPVLPSAAGAAAAGEADVQRPASHKKSSRSGGGKAAAAAAAAAVVDATSGNEVAPSARDCLPPLTSMPLRAVDPGGGFKYMTLSIPSHSAHSFVKLHCTTLFPSSVPLPSSHTDGRRWPRPSPLVNVAHTFTKHVHPNAFADTQFCVSVSTATATCLWPTKSQRDTNECSYNRTVLTHKTQCMPNLDAHT
jgi:hypothetical protein